MHSLLHALKTHPKFNRTELTQILITVVLAGFYFSFDDWGLQEVNYAAGIQNFLGATLAFFLIITTIVIAQKILGVAFGYTIEYEYSWVGLVVGFFLTALTYGLIPFFLPGGLKYQLIKHRRLGQFDSGYKQIEMFFIAGLSVVIALIYASIFGSIFLSTEVELFRYLTVAALLVAVFSLVPAPNLKPLSKWNMKGVSDFSILKKVHGGSFGFDMLAFGTLAYYFLAGFTAIYTILVLFFQTFSAILSAIFLVLLLIVYKVAISFNS